MFKRWIGSLATRSVHASYAARALLLREFDHLAREVGLARALLPLLARPRTQGWSRDERAELRTHLWRISRLSSWLMLTLLPGAFLALPLIALWRDRRRNRRQAEKAEA